MSSHAALIPEWSMITLLRTGSSNAMPCRVINFAGVAQICKLIMLPTFVAGHKHSVSAASSPMRCDQSVRPRDFCAAAVITSSGSSAVQESGIGFSRHRQTTHVQAQRP